MQIKTATQEELGLLIYGLRQFTMLENIKTQKRLLAYLKRELVTRYGVVLNSDVAKEDDNE